MGTWASGEDPDEMLNLSISLGSTLIFRDRNTS